MSNIYIQEPPTNGKVLFKTTVGEIDIELWSKESPLACRNFVQLCLDGYYDNCIFHRLVKGFIVQTGDPTGTGFGGESIYGKPFKDEFHSRLRFVRRGLVAMANSGEKDSNGSQFFFTLESTPELQNIHTIFGKVTGNTLYNMLRLGEGDVDKNERPVYPHKIIATEILNNPFPDIEKREKKHDKIEKSKEKKAREKVKANKNYSLLSFGDEAEEEEKEITRISDEFKNKSKSSHDLLKEDSKLSSIPVVDQTELSQGNDDDDFHQDKSSESEKTRMKRLSKIKEKLNLKTKLTDKDNKDDDVEDEEIDYLEEEKLQRKNQEIEKAKDEFKKIKKQLLKSSRNDQDQTENKAIIEKSSAVSEFVEESKKFKEASKQIKKKGEGREEQCWELLQRFKNRLQDSKSSQKSNNDDDEGDASITNFKNAWLTHTMNCTGEDEIVLARDANIRNEEDWYDIYDPRNPINKRRRNET